MRDSVRLAAGLRADRHLSPPVAARALACLRRFGERLRGIPAHQVRAVGTNTMRKLAVGNEFVAAATTALGHPIEVIAGAEEARLVDRTRVVWGTGVSVRVNPGGRRDIKKK